MKRILAGFFGSVIVSAVFADIWTRGLVPVGAPQIPAKAWFCLLALLGLVRIALMTNPQLEEMSEADKKQDAFWFWFMVRMLVLLFSFISVRLVLAIP